MSSLARILGLLCMLTFVGVGWFWLVDGWSPVDALYMTVITLSTVGYTEVRPLNDADKLFITGYLAVGLGVFLFGVVQIGESIVRAELGQWWRKRNMNQSIGAMTNHFVVCGGGRMGRLLCEDLAERNIPFVLLDFDRDVVENAKMSGWNTICADATEDEALAEAGIDRAAGLAAVLGDDADNLYVVVSTRLISPTLQIVARAQEERSIRKLRKAGANRVVNPYESGAAKMGQLLTNPRLNEFVEIIADRKLSFDLVGLPVTKESPWVGKKLAETGFGARGVMVIAIRHADGSVDLAPTGETILRSGDELFALGDTNAVNALR